MAREDELARIDAEIETVRERLRQNELRTIAFEAAADQDLAACAEAEKCGCPVYVGVIDDEDVYGSARVVHGCSRG